MEATIKIVKVCSTSEERVAGLMNTSISEDECCVFVFDDAQILKFWNRNVPQDLCVSLVDASVVHESLHMSAYSPKPVSSIGKYAIAIESRLDIPVGAAIKFCGDSLVVSFD